MLFDHEDESIGVAELDTVPDNTYIWALPASWDDVAVEDFATNLMDVPTVQGDHCFVLVDSINADGIDVDELTPAETEQLLAQLEDDGE